MDYKIKLDNMLNQENGILLESEAINAGISKYRFLEYVRMNNLERIAQGIYMLSLIQITEPTRRRVIAYSL